jgi:hypothetical protein
LEVVIVIVIGAAFPDENEDDTNFKPRLRTVYSRLRVRPNLGQTSR